MANQQLNAYRNYLFILSNLRVKGLSTLFATIYEVDLLSNRMLHHRFQGFDPILHPSDGIPGGGHLTTAQAWERVEEMKGNLQALVERVLPVPC